MAFWSDLLGALSADMIYGAVSGKPRHGGHAMAPAPAPTPPAHDAGGHGDSHDKGGHGSKRGKGKGGHGKSGDGHGGDAKHDTAHAAPAVAPAVAAGAAMRADIARFIDKLLVDNRKLLFHALRVTPTFDKNNIEAHLDEASKGKSRMMENKLVDTLLKAITVYEGDTLKLRADARKVLRHLNGLSSEAFWREMDLIDHNPIEQHVVSVLSSGRKAMRKNPILGWVLRNRSL